MGKKDHIRDYATEAFRLYKREGGVESYKNKIWNDALPRSQRSELNGLCQFGGDFISKPTEAAVMRAQGAIDDAAATVADLEAVERTLEIIGRLKSGTAMLEAVRIVYFTDAEKPIAKAGIIRDRVHKAGIYIPASERTIYYWLKKARTVFAVERGLRL